MKGSLAEMKGEVQEELQQLEKHLSEMDELKNESINKIEARKKELRRLSEIESIRQEHTKVLEEMIAAKKDIDERRLSIAFMDQTITNLDEYGLVLVTKQFQNNLYIYNIF